jgi:uncharacterized SAM-binding protein YcdF (DUF218 family)
MLQLVDPLTVTLALLVLGLILLTLRRRVTAGLLVILAFGWTYALATPVVANWLRGGLEQRFPPTPLGNVPDADAIVVLGGGVEPTARPRLYPNLGNAADRVWHGARLFKADKAPLVITTGRRPFNDAGQAAAEAQAQFLTSLGVPREAIVAPGDSVRTHTDSQIVERIADERGLDQLLLVTSALHMPRAMAVFQSAGLMVFPVPADFEVTQVGYRDESPWLPSTEAWASSARALHEYAGMIWYRHKGWI